MKTDMDANMKADIYMMIGSIFIVLGVALGVWMLVRHRTDQQGGR